tara:strand:- start:262 stop:453 length:192 start_codon:yes stop_codon:yes gene_type:complete
MKIPKTLNDVIKPDLYSSLSPEDKFRFLMLYVQQNKNLNNNQHEAVLKMTEEEFKKLERGEKL